MSTLKHLEVLTAEERESVLKFNDYGATILLGYGNKATWPELVHGNAYSDTAIKDKLTSLKQKQVNEQNAADEDELEPTPEFMLSDRNGQRIAFSVTECVNFIRAVRKVRKYFDNAKEIAQLEASLAAIKNKKLTKEERLTNQESDIISKINKLKGIKDEPVAQPATSSTEE